MTLPQCTVAPLLGLAGNDSVLGMIFGARVAATLVAGDLDKRFPYQRALGVSHVVTFGPLLAWMITSGYWNTKPDSFKGAFLWMQLRVMAICLFLDARDVLFQLAGYPYPCYIREAAINQKLNVKDPKALKPVTWWSRIFGP